MKKLILLVALAACHHSAAVSSSPAPRPAAGGNQIGAVDASAAVNGFLKAAKAQDIQGMSSLFGGPNGLLREIDTQANVEKRLLTMICYLKYDSYKIAREKASTGGTRLLTVDITLGTSTLTSDFTTVPNANGRWFVQQFDLQPLEKHCGKT